MKFRIGVILKLCSCNRFRADFDDSLLGSRVMYVLSFLFDKKNG